MEIKMKDSEVDQALTAGIAAAMITVLLTPVLLMYSVFSSGFVLNKAFIWFVTPEFNYAAPNWFVCGTIASIIGYVTTRPNKKDSGFWVLLIRPWMFLLFSYIVMLIKPYVI